MLKLYNKGVIELILVNIGTRWLEYALASSCIFYSHLLPTFTSISSVILYDNFEITINLILAKDNLDDIYVVKYTASRMTTFMKKI